MTLGSVAQFSISESRWTVRAGSRTGLRIGCVSLVFFAVNDQFFDVAMGRDVWQKGKGGESECGEDLHGGVLL